RRRPAPPTGAPVTAAPFTALLNSSVLGEPVQIGAEFGGDDLVPIVPGWFVVDTSVPALPGDQIGRQVQVALTRAQGCAQHRVKRAGKRCAAGEMRDAGGSRVALLGAQTAMFDGTVGGVAGGEDAPACIADAAVLVDLEEAT